MRAFVATLFTALCLSLIGGQAEEKVSPPMVKIIPKKLEKHGHVRTDNYYWLGERDNPEVVAYLRAENEHTAAVMAPTQGLQEKLSNEFRNRIKQTDMSAPYKKDDFYYYTRTEEGQQYPIYCRKARSIEATEQIMLDVNQAAEGHEFCSAPRPEVSSGQNIMAYAVDTVGRRFYTIRFKDLIADKLLDDVIPNVTGNMVWANDNKTLFYSRQDPLTLRSYRIYRHVLGIDPATDELLYEETDETFNCGVFKTKSKKYIIIASTQTLSTEFRHLDADNPDGQFRIFQPRQKDHEYQVDHYGDYFYVRTNYHAKNFRLMKTPIAKTDIANWEEVIPHRDDVFLERMELFKDYLVAVERKNGLLQMRILPWSGPGEHDVDFGEPAYAAHPSDNYDFDTLLVRFTYSSMTTPQSVYDYNMATREKKLLKREEVLGGFDSANYRTERIYATAEDGARVPISLVYRTGFKKNGANPLLLYGYGSYGYSLDASFDPYHISLLDRGFVFALAHVRGGQEMGRQWYEDGKLLKKKNTFTDFIACAEHLIHEKYADPQRVFAMGGSAGGLLMGAVVNLRPDLFNGVIGYVPWVDVVTTMLDDDIPLTTSEYDEWGNPNDKKFYDYMLSYSPYDQVQAKDYPNLLVRTSLQDSQVQYWEPAKWVARLRALKTDHHRLLLKTEIEAGHGGVSGRYKRYGEVAFDYAFLLDLAGIKE
ncbi:MAG: S9 family peptidase [Acidobacteria bacterium]|nr:S9 family peptidase [Acidobacteriota bacterium]